MPVSFLGETVGERQAKIVRIPVCRLASGAELAIAVHVLRGGGDGPTVGIMSAHHGEELFTTELMRRLRGMLLDGRFRGTVLMVPCANPPSFEAGTRNTPIDMHNLNRVFPGDAAGWLTDKIAAAIWKHFVPSIDALIDYHCGGVDTEIHYTYTMDPSTPIGRRVQELALLGSARVLWETAGPGGSLAREVVRRDVPTVILEVGGGPSFGTDLMDRGLDAANRVLRKLGVLDGPASAPEPRIVVRKGGSVRPAHGGLFLPEVGHDALGGTVAGGTVLGRVVAPDTFEELEVIRAPYPRTAVMMVRSRISKVHPGEYAYILGDEDSGGPA
ncbi:MAG TPA: succinylglutamate desuccinylase/aspartoacylase family protein [bacterium]|nr:succinylglutamate desuccinylase/aspartoacylase family protein [bacterium]